MSSPVSPSKAYHDRLPPSPPKSPGSSLSRIVSYIAALRDGDGDPTAQSTTTQTFSILESEYAQLDSCLGRDGLYDFYHNKLRHDYDPSLGHLIFRMPTARHDVFIHDFVNLILTKIADQARILEQDNPIISQRLLELRTFSTTNLNLLNDEKPGHKSPDASIGYPDQVYPQIVFEASYSQARKALKSLAWSYIMDSSHSIRCVVGLDLDYPRKRSPPSSRAHDVRINVWRPLVDIEGEIESMDVKQEITDEPLGEHNPGHEIAALCIRDLLDDEMLEATPPGIAECKIVITSNEMVESLEVAERVQESLRRGTEIASQKRLAPNRHWRKRRITPDEELSEGRESKYRISESTVEQQRSDDDTSYAPAARSPGRSIISIRHSTRSRTDA
ncbi:hypothetical protein D6C87_10716 [Aureobasidium pullulans]|uniref:HNH nuclease domain-containing protein n=1 Tax=Aureobasidium pullulans TaxID=5580 RepID=A0AB38LH82_AURPU|nr:hypothetical protein D6C94_10721 [Aureobasidium pullulans]THZ33771.1 hypothetical protein D6C87_10716 [Aureobasidium pullulans]THZ73352.1 hypothetical protein D6C88_07211 [Aureobasidium pullulans]